MVSGTVSLRESLVDGRATRKEEQVNVKLKPLAEQVVVIVGASSGIGLVTARMASERGAKVVLAARNEEELVKAVEAIRRNAGRAAHVVADVTDPRQVERIGETALHQFGRIDTWVNNAAVSMYGTIMELELDDMRRQMDVNFWGQVHGCRAAVRYLRREGGALINVASVLADRAIPLQGIYCAAKHALKAFTDALRMELEADGVPITITLIKPASIDTPFFEKARNYLDESPQPVPPVYAPEVVARAILAAAERSVRELVAGGAAGMLSLGQALSPRLTDRYLERYGFRQQQTGRPAAPRESNNLYAPLSQDGGERGHNWNGRVHERSFYTEARLQPGRAALLAAGLGLVALAGLRALRRD
jgi:short-subunit dehydrogenase